MTPQAVKEQIAQEKQHRLGVKFLPPNIRNAEEKEFKHMEDTLVPLAEDLQQTLSTIHFTIRFTEDEGVFLDSDEVEDWIEKASMVEVPEDICRYYDQLQKIIAAWKDLCEWCKDSGFAQPPYSLYSSLAEHPTGPKQPCRLILTPDTMLDLWARGLIHHELAGGV